MPNGMKYSRAALLALGLAASAACSSDVSVAEPGTTPPPVDTGGSTVQRGSLAVTARVADADTAVARAIGLSGGLLAGATVTVQRTGTGDAPLTATADAAGVARFAGLLPGTYTVAVLRALSAGEATRLPAPDRDVTGFGGGANAQLGNGQQAAASVPAAAGRRGSLVISQVMPSIPLGPDGEAYQAGQFIQVYNNSDTTIYLDGKLIALALKQMRDYASPRSCAELARWRLDDLGIWSKFIYAFPGSGRQYALAAAASATIATDALDHRAFVASLPDLSRADFEFIGPKDVDNPSVPNMRLFGPSEFDPAVLGRGLRFWGIDQVIILANDVDSAAFEQADIPGIIQPRFWRVPAESILDVVSSVSEPAVEASLSAAPCAQLTPPSFDRQHGAFFLEERGTYSFARKTFMTLPSGRRVLQRTRTSSQDFENIAGSQPR